MASSCSRPPSEDGMGSWAKRSSSSRRGTAAGYQRGASPVSAGRVAENRQQRQVSVMRTPRLPAAALAALLLLGVGCAPDIQVETEKVEDFDFSSVKTWAWVTDEPIMIKAGGGNEAIRTERNEKRIREAIEVAIGGKGYTKVDRTEADLLVAFSLGADMRYRLSGGGASYDLAAAGASEKQTKGAVTVYVFDKASNEKVWQGTVSKWVRQEGETDETLQMGAKKLFEPFPAAK